jgi:hypothetical protein
MTLQTFARRRPRLASNGAAGSVSEAEELVRRVMDAHNRGADVLLDAFDDIFDPDSTVRGRVSGATVEEDIALVYWARDGRLVRGEAFRSRQDAQDAAHA